MFILPQTSQLPQMSLKHCFMWALFHYYFFLTDLYDKIFLNWWECNGSFHIHRARGLTECFKLYKKNNNVSRMLWSSQSPDLNQELDSVLQHHQQNSSWEKIFCKESVDLSNTIPAICRMSADALELFRRHVIDWHLIKMLLVCFFLIYLLCTLFVWMFYNILINCHHLNRTHRQWARNISLMGYHKFKPLVQCYSLTQ